MSKDLKIKHSIYSSTRQISREVGVNLNVEFDGDALDLIAELVWKKLSLYGSDLEAFEKHAKRSTITADDVKLLVRRNNSLKELIDSKLQIIQSNKRPEVAASAAPKRKRKNAP